MSENAPTRLRIAPSYERGSAPVGEDMQNVPRQSIDTQAGHELDTSHPTAADFYATLSEYSDLLKADNGDDFDAGEWLKHPKEGSDEAVFTDVMARLSDESEPLREYEVRVLGYLKIEVALRLAENALENQYPTAFDENSNLENILHTRADELAAESGDVELVNALRSSEAVLTRPDTSDDHATPMNRFYTQAKERAEAGTIPDKEVILDFLKSANERKNMTNAYMHLTEHIAEKESLQSDAEVQEELAEKAELEAAIKNLDDLRTKLAITNARREKRLWGVDSGLGDSVASHASKELKEQYRAASQDVLNRQFGEFFADETIDHNEKVMMIARHTAAEGNRLDQETLVQFASNKSRLGKTIDWYGNLSGKKKLAIGMLGGLGLSIATGGVGAFVVSGAALATTLEAGRRKKREAGENMLGLDDKAEEIFNTLQTRLDGTNGKATIDTIDLDSAAYLAHHNVDQRFESRINKEQLKRTGRVLGSVAVAAAAGSLVQWAVGGGYLFGGENAAAVDPSSASGAGAEQVAQIQPPAVEAPLPSAETFFGPSNVYVSPGDGFNSVFENMNIPESQWNSVLQQIGPDLVQNGDAYWMPDGTPGISSPGMLSQHAYEAIMRAKGL